MSSVLQYRKRCFRKQFVLYIQNECMLPHCHKWRMANFVTSLLWAGGAAKFANSHRWQEGDGRLTNGKQALADCWQVCPPALHLSSPIPIGKFGNPSLSQLGGNKIFLHVTIISRIGLLSLTLSSLISQTVIRTSTNLVLTWLTFKIHFILTFCCDATVSSRVRSSSTALDGKKVYLTLIYIEKYYALRPHHQHCSWWKRTVSNIDLYCQILCFVIFVCAKAIIPKRESPFISTCVALWRNDIDF